jgi:hypothetical protein
VDTENVVTNSRKKRIHRMSAMVAQRPLASFNVQGTFP